MILFGSTMDWFKRHFDIKPWFVVNHEGVLYICRLILAWWDYYGPKTHQTHWRQNIWNNWLGKKGLAYESQAMTSLKGKSWGKASEKKKRVNTTKQFHHRYCWNGIILYIYWLIQMKWQLHTTTMFAIVCLCRLSCPQHSKPDVSGYLRQCLMILTVSSDWTHSPDLNQPTWPTSAQVIVYPLAVKNGNGKASIHRWFSQQRLYLSWLFAMFGYQRVIPLGIATSSQSPQFYHGNSDDLNPHNQRMVGFDRESQPMDSMDHDNPPLYPRI